MTTHNEPNNHAGDVNTAISEHVHRYRSRLLTTDQSDTMLEDIRIAVLRAEPTSRQIAGNWMSIVCRFVADTMPATGAKFSEIFTPAKIASWVCPQFC